MSSTGRNEVEPRRERMTWRAPRVVPISRNTWDCRRAHCLPKKTLGKLPRTLGGLPRPFGKLPRTLADLPRPFGELPRTLAGSRELSAGCRDPSADCRELSALSESPRQVAETLWRSAETSRRFLRALAGSRDPSASCRELSAVPEDSRQSAETLRRAAESSRQLPRALGRSPRLLAMVARDQDVSRVPEASASGMRLMSGRAVSSSRKRRCSARCK
jgi:hypothetical protein